MFGPTYRLIKILQLLLFSLVFYSVARLEFYLWNRSHYQDKALADTLLSFVVGLRFDISAVMSLLVLPLLLSFVPWPQSWDRVWRGVVFVLFVVLQLPFLMINLVDTEFINFVGRRFSFDSIFIVNEVPGKFTNFLVSYWLLFLINILLLLMMAVGAYWLLFCVREPVLHFADKKLGRAKLYLSHAFLCFVAVVIFVVGIRGGLQSKPLSFVSANIFAAPVLNNLVLNSSFTFIKSFKEDKLKKEKFFTDKDEMLKYLNGSNRAASLLAGHRFAEKQNVVIIILESFGAEYWGPQKSSTKFLLPKQGAEAFATRSFTPFLDQLSRKSLVFTNAYANARRSIEGVAAIMAGVPAMMNEPFISSHFTSNYFLGMGSLLGQGGYHTSFFHGANNGSMYFDSFMQSAGIEHYYGAREFPDSRQHDGVWGIWDEPFLQFMSEKLNTFPQPFLASTFTLTSHQPYKVPTAYQDRLPEGEIPILKGVAYTDLALREFFAAAEKQAWFQNTLFVITADHTAGHFQPEYSSDWGDYHIPLMFYHPRMQWPASIDRDQVVQQIDVLPSVLDFLNVRRADQNFLGSSVFVPGDKTASIFIDGRYLLFAKESFIRKDLGASQVTMFAKNDLTEKSPLPDSPRRRELEKKLNASIQYFSEGMWDNKLYYPTVR